MLTFSPTIGELAKAMVAAQLVLEPAIKESNNPAFKSKYAKLAEILEKVIPAYAGAGIAFSQHPDFIDGKVVVETILLHISGEWMRSELHMAVFKSDAHGIGGGTTYACRYAASAITGLAVEDDDGNAASGYGKNGEKPRDKPTRTENKPENKGEAQTETPEPLPELTEAQKVAARFTKIFNEKVKFLTDRAWPKEEAVAEVTKKKDELKLAYPGDMDKVLAELEANPFING